MLSGGNIILEEDYDENYVPTADEIEEYAKWLGMNPVIDKSLYWIAGEGLRAPLPKNWKPCQTTDGEIFYFNFDTGDSVWEHPCDAFYRKMFLDEKEKLHANPSPKKTEESTNCCVSNRQCDPDGSNQIIKDSAIQQIEIKENGNEAGIVAEPNSSEIVELRRELELARRGQLTAEAEIDRLNDFIKSMEPKKPSVVDERKEMEKLAAILQKNEEQLRYEFSKKEIGLEKQIEQCQRELDGLNEELADALKSAENWRILYEKMSDSKDDEIHSLNERVEKSESEKSELVKVLSVREKEFEKSKQDLVLVQTELEDANSLCNSFNSQIIDIENQIDHLKNELTAKDSEILKKEAEWELNLRTHKVQLDEVLQKLDKASDNNPKQIEFSGSRLPVPVLDFGKELQEIKAAIDVLSSRASRGGILVEQRNHDFNSENDDAPSSSIRQRTIHSTRSRSSSTAAAFSHRDSNPRYSYATQPPPYICVGDDEVEGEEEESIDENECLEFASRHDEDQSRFQRLLDKKWIESESRKWKRDSSILYLSKISESEFKKRQIELEIRRKSLQEKIEIYNQNIRKIRVHRRQFHHQLLHEDSGESPLPSSSRWRRESKYGALHAADTLGRHATWLHELKRKV